MYNEIRTKVLHEKWEYSEMTKLIKKIEDLEKENIYLKEENFALKELLQGIKKYLEKSIPGKYQSS